MFTKRFALIVLLLSAFVACTPAQPEPRAGQGPTPAAEQIAEEALPVAQQALADFLNVDLDALQLDKIQDAEWPNGCLGLAAADEMCTEAIVPGFEFTFIVDGMPYVVRSDMSGTAVRVEAAYAAPQTGEGGDDLPAAVQAALAERAQATGIQVAQVELISFSSEEWSDACLGLGSADEMCAAVITPGYLVVVRAGDQVFNVRTDASGTTVRAQETTDRATAYPSSVVNAREALAQKLGVPAVEIDVVSFEQLDWPDACLGLGGAAELCAAVITPGWRVVLNHAGTEYEARTDMNGDSVRIADAGQTPPATGTLLPDIGKAVAFY